VVRRLTQECSDTQAVFRLGSSVLRLCSGRSGLLTLGLGRSGSSSRPETETELAKEKINTESRGIQDMAQGTGGEDCLVECGL